jgi:hypothetical protein
MFPGGCRPAAIPFGIKSKEDANTVKYVNYIESIHYYLLRLIAGSKAMRNKFVPLRRRSDKKGSWRPPS